MATARRGGTPHQRRDPDGVRWWPPPPDPASACCRPYRPRSCSLPGCRAMCDRPGGIARAPDAGPVAPLRAGPGTGGSGKTTLLTAWRHAPRGAGCRRGLAWSLAKPGDDDPHRFGVVPASLARVDAELVRPPSSCSTGTTMTMMNWAVTLAVDWRYPSHACSCSTTQHLTHPRTDACCTGCWTMRRAGFHLVLATRHGCPCRWSGGGRRANWRSRPAGPALQPRRSPLASCVPQVAASAEVDRLHQATGRLGWPATGGGYRCGPVRPTVLFRPGRCRIRRHSPATSSGRCCGVCPREDLDLR